jgi:hypothetical protein
LGENLPGQVVFGPLAPAYWQGQNLQGVWGRAVFQPRLGDLVDAGTEPG